MSIQQCPHCKKPLPEPVEIIKMAESVYCANCECITKAQNSHCLACGSGSVVNLERLLRGQSTDKRGTHERIV